MRHAVRISFILFLLITCFFSVSLRAQDSLTLSPSGDPAVLLSKAPKHHSKSIFIDTLNKFNPRIATIRSAIIPGWGQVYNHQAWKVPLVYGALGTTAAIFIYNLKE